MPVEVEKMSMAAGVVRKRKPTSEPSESPIFPLRRHVMLSVRNCCNLLYPAAIQQLASYTLFNRRLCCGFERMRSQLDMSWRASET